MQSFADGNPTDLINMSLRITDRHILQVSQFIGHYGAAECFVSEKYAYICAALPTARMVE